MSNTQKSLAYLKKYLRAYQKPIVISVVIYLLATAAQVAAPTLLGMAVTDLSAFVKESAQGHATLTRFYQALTWMAAFYALNSIATYIAWMMMTRFNANANNDMRKGLFGKL
ncbi:MAG: ABC transporter ATP-binding protein, partial [Lactobacillus porci]|nr:ABC transporter ATP-binding protein [Lactobacillus porci]